MSNDHRHFAVSSGVPIYVLPFQPDLGKQDPRTWLRRAEKKAGLRLRRFRLVSAP